MKLYLAIELGEALAAQFPADLELPPHVTVLYVADLAPELVGPALAAIAGVVERAEPFDLELGGLGSFEHPDGKVVWAGLPEVAVGFDQVRCLRRDLLAALCAAGVGARQEHAGYTPHATLGRIPLGATWDGEVPAGREQVTAIRVVIDDDRRYLLPLGESVTTQASVRAWTEGRADLSQPFVALSVGKVYDRRTGKLRGVVTPQLLAELVRVFETRRDVDPVPLDWDHGSAEDSGPDRGTAMGVIERMWVEGEQLWMQPQLTARGRKVIADHQLADGESALYPSPEWVEKAAGLTCRKTGESYGWAQTLAVACTPRPAQVATALSTIRLSESQNPGGEPDHPGGEPDQSAEAQMYNDPIQLMAFLRAQGVDEEKIAELLGDAYVAPVADGATPPPPPAPPAGGGEMAEGEGEGGKPEDEEPAEVQAMNEKAARRIALAEQKAAAAQRKADATERELRTLLSERKAERAAALKSRIEADLELAVREGRCGADDDSRFMFCELAERAEAAKLTARTANPQVTDDALAKLADVRVFHRAFSEVRPDFADMSRTFGHGQRPADPAGETLDSVVIAFGEKAGIDTSSTAGWLEAERRFAEKNPRKLAELYRKEGLLGR